MRTGTETEPDNDLEIMCNAILDKDDNWQNRIPKCECCGATCGNYTRSFGSRKLLTLCAACWALLAAHILNDLKEHRPPWVDDTDFYLFEIKKISQEKKDAEEKDGQ